MRTIVWFSLSVVLAAGQGCSESTRDQHAELSAVELRHALRLRELENPLEYLSQRNVALETQTPGIRRASLLREPETGKSRPVLLKGELRNEATLARFRDVQVKVKYFSKNKKVLTENIHVVHEQIDPGTLKEFAIHDTPPDGMDDFQLWILGATPVYE